MPVTVAKRLMRALLVRAAVTVVRSLPPAAVPALAWLGGTAWYAYDGRRRRRVAENLKVAFGPDAGGSGRRRRARAVFCNMARVPIEVIWFDRLLASPRQFARRCTFHGPWTPGQGGVLFTGHLGAWETLIRAAPHRLGRLVTVVRRIPDPWIDSFVNRTRGEVVAKHGAYRTLTRAVQEGAWVFIAGDQNAGADGPFIPFLGLPASTHVSPALLALREGRPLALALALRRPGTAMHFDLVFEPIAHAAPHEPDEGEVRALLEQLSERLGAWVLRHPEEYNFLHRRWKDRPADEPPGPHLPVYDHHRPRAH